MTRLKYLLVVFSVLTVTGCEKNRWADFEAKLIQEYIDSLEDTVYVKYPSGLYYIELNGGTGPFPADNDTVYFKYKAAFIDYVQFDTNEPYTKPVEYVLGSYVGMSVKGVDEGLHYMRKGGTARLLTPSSLAYGFEGIWGIVAGYTPIIWTLELDSIKVHAGR
ncbi:MAG TPA: FKBP-type peptidyl-prolyl cis-trans isomerase [Bacteroidales bacterium]|nr:FKBP-type peptidyl-prolyl cis-trans isomerase [Bacteroidales bacterium]HPF03041.1 FKBP-type peptidyl-prolyl cis-trans isomerase [Bacteroidales bacterium]